MLERPRQLVGLSRRLLFLLLFGFLFTAPLVAQDDIRTLARRISAETLSTQQTMKHLEDLCRVAPGRLSGTEACDRAAGRITVAGRKDLRQHFVISAALEVLSDAGVSFAIGEFKELTDSGRGGSGFSFVDLAADRAGLKFAELALTSGGAAAVQRNARALEDPGFFFPSIRGLEEGLTAAQFEQRYGSVESEAYVAVVNEIDRRIARLPLFKAAR